MTSPHLIRHGLLTLPLPEGWLDMSQVMALGPEDDGFRSSLVVSMEPVSAHESVWDFAERTLQGLQQISADFEVVTEGQAIFGGKEGVLREHTFSAQGVHVAQLQFYTLKWDLGWTFTYTQRAEQLQETRALAESLFAQARLGLGEEAQRLSFIRA
jgi:hypothetical protein